MKEEDKKKKAIAIKYDPSKDQVPQIIAKGKGFLAEKILKIAREKGIPIKDDPILAEALYTIEIGEEIPESLYEAVAEVLAFIFRLRNYSGSYSNLK